MMHTIRLPLALLLGLGFWLDSTGTSLGSAEGAGPAQAPSVVPSQAAAPAQVPTPPKATGAPLSLLGVEASGKPFQLASDRGRVVAVVILSRYTSKQAAPMQDALGPLSRPGKLDVISVIDLMGVPGMFHGYAKRKVIDGAKKSQMRFLVDDQGTWRRFFGAQPDKRVDILVIDQQGRLRGHFIGPAQLTEAEHMIRALLDQSGQGGQSAQTGHAA